MESTLGKKTALSLCALMASIACSGTGDGNQPAPTVDEQSTASDENENPAEPVEAGVQSGDAGAESHTHENQNPAESAETSAQDGDAGVEPSADGRDATPKDGETASEAAEAGAPDSDVSAAMATDHPPDRGNLHVAIGTEVTYEDSPPSSGDHYPIWTRYEAFDEVVPRAYWVHSLEHGAIALLYGPNATAEHQAQLRALYDRIPVDSACGHSRALLTEDPELQTNFALVAWTWTLAGDTLDEEAALDFIIEHRGRALEDVCGHGEFTP